MYLHSKLVRVAAAALIVLSLVTPSLEAKDKSKKSDKKVERCEGDGFANVRFEARPKGWKRLDPWKWKENPFLGMHQLQGLKVLMALLNNWDLKDTNNVVIFAPGRGRRGELRYVISDLGATFGKEGGGPGFLWRITRSRNKPGDYADTKFITRSRMVTWTSTSRGR